MSDEDQLTPEGAEEIAKLAASILNVVGKTMEQTPIVDWEGAISACALACRGLASAEMGKNASLSFDGARSIVFDRFVQVLSMPEELIKVVQTEGGGPLEADFIPVRRH